MKILINHGLPSKPGIESFTRKLSVSLFPVKGGRFSYLISKRGLFLRLCILLKPIQESLQESPEKTSRDFITSLPELKNQLERDAGFIFKSDPAATSVNEVIMTYPGFYAILVYRLANRLAQLGVPVIPRVMSEHAHSVTGIDIHPKASIGSPFFIDHGTGIVIGETAIIGDGVKIYQGVTIGALSVTREMAGKKRHPTVEDNVIIYAGSTILGGDTVIGHDSIIGGSVWLTQSVPPFSLVYHENVMKVRDRGSVL